MKFFLRFFRDQNQWVDGRTDRNCDDHVSAFLVSQFGEPRDESELVIEGSYEIHERNYRPATELSPPESETSIEILIWSCRLDDMLVSRPEVLNWLMNEFADELLHESC